MSAPPGVTYFTTGVRSVELLAQIIDKSQQVIRLRAECRQLGNAAAILLAILQDNEEVLKNQRSKSELDAVLKNVADFVKNCTKQYNLFQRAWEVWWIQQLPSLERDMMKWALFFTLESSASTRKAASAITQQLTAISLQADQSRVEQNQELKRTLESHQQSIQHILEQEKKHREDKERLGMKINFPNDDRRLEVEQDGEGFLNGTLDNMKVICQPINTTEMKYGKAARIAYIYSMLAGNTLVHGYHGLAERNDRVWAVMDDLRDSKSIQSLMKDGALPIDPKVRLMVAYDLAKTVAYLHSAQILIKNLSDKNVLLVQEVEEGTAWKPILTDLDQARLFLENTTGKRYDVRFEAPEVQRQLDESARTQHSEAGDVWSLGVLIWECLSGKSPFGLVDPVWEGSLAVEIRNHLSEGGYPWAQKDHGLLPPQIMQLLRSCCHSLPSIRPPAKSVESILLGFMTEPSKLSASIDRSREDEMILPQLQSNLERVKREEVKASEVKLSEADTERIRTLCAQGDAVANFLMGSALWYGLADLASYESQIVVVVGRELEKDRRAQAARPYLECAAHAGEKQSAELLMKVHTRLFNLYKGQVSQMSAEVT